MQLQTTIQHWQKYLFSGIIWQPCLKGRSLRRKETGFLSLSLALSLSRLPKFLTDFCQAMDSRCQIGFLASLFMGLTISHANRRLPRKPQVGWPTPQFSIAYFQDFEWRRRPRKQSNLTVEGFGFHKLGWVRLQQLSDSVTYCLMWPVSKWDPHFFTVFFLSVTIGNSPLVSSAVP